MVRNAPGTSHVWGPDRVFAADGRSCSESDHMELSHRFSELIARLERAHRLDPGAAGR